MVRPFKMVHLTCRGTVCHCFVESIIFRLSDDGRDGHVVLGCHQAMVMRLTGDLLIPLGKVACKSGDL